MAKGISRLMFPTVILFLAVTTGSAQDEPQCRGRIYTAQEVTRRAKIVSSLEIGSPSGIAPGQPASVALRAVLCRTGRVTDIKLVKGKPSELTKYLELTVSNVTFTPAELNWHSVSQAMEFEFEINGGETKVISSAEARGRLVERLEIIGTRRLTPDQIIAWITTTSGEPYDADQVQRDLSTLLAKGLFDKRLTRVMTEDAPRGGVAVIFEVAELPLIRELKISGVGEPDRLAVLRTLSQAHVEKDEPYDVVQVKVGVGMIKRVLASRGWEDVQVDVSSDAPNTTELILTFSISGRKSQ